MLRPRQLFALMDFTSTMTADKPGAGEYVQDCVVVLEYYNAAAVRTRRNYDFLCTGDTNKHDFHFVLQVWVWLFKILHLNEHFDRIDLWTDGGPHHFKTRFCQATWHALSVLRFDRKPITHNFFASYHGHSLADGHAAVVKRCLHSQYLLSELERTTHQPDATWGPAGVKEVAEVISRKCANTEVVVFNEIDRDGERRPTVRSIPGIKSYHWFLYQDGKCYAKERSGHAGITEFKLD
jgi:hypothetical protein